MQATGQVLIETANYLDKAGKWSSPSPLTINPLDVAPTPHPHSPELMGLHFSCNHKAAAQTEAEWVRDTQRQAGASGSSPTDPQPNGHAGLLTGSLSRHWF